MFVHGGGVIDAGEVDGDDAAFACDLAGGGQAPLGELPGCQPLGLLCDACGCADGWKSTCLYRAGIAGCRISQIGLKKPGSVPETLNEVRCGIPVAIIMNGDSRTGSGKVCGERPPDSPAGTCHQDYFFRQINVHIHLGLISSQKS